MLLEFDIQNEHFLHAVQVDDLSWFKNLIIGLHGGLFSFCLVLSSVFLINFFDWGALYFGLGARHDRFVNDAIGCGCLRVLRIIDSLE